MHSKGSMCCFSHAFFSVCLSSEYFGVSKNAGLFTSVVWWGILEIIYRLEQRNSKMLQIFTDASVLVYRVVGGLVIVLWWETYSLSKWTEHSDLFGSWKLPARTARFGIPAECFIEEHPKYRLSTLVIIICDPHIHIGNLLIQLTGTKFKI